MSRNARDAILAGLFALAVFYTLYFARLLPVAMAVLLALILSPAVGTLARRSRRSSRAAASPSIRW